MNYINRHAKHAFVLLILLSLAYRSAAQDKVFATVYQTNVLPYGARDFEFWTTSRNGHKPNFYWGMDNRFEFEMGLGKSVQTSFYFNTDNSMYGDPEMKVDGLSHDIGIGISNEWKWKLSDPVADGFGTALYQEFEFEPDEFESESKFILDKRIGQNLIAVNAFYQYQVHIDASKGKMTTTTSSPVELDFGFMHFLGNNCGIGVEMKEHNDISQSFGWENSILYAGPSVFFNGSGWMISINILPQLNNFHKTSISPESLVLDSHERLESRVVLSFNL